MVRRRASLSTSTSSNIVLNLFQREDFSNIMTDLSGHFTPAGRDSSGLPILAAKQGPSPADWERVRPLLKSLYIDEDRTLNDVISIMASEHDHKAT